MALYANKYMERFVLERDIRNGVYWMIILCRQTSSRPKVDVFCKELLEESRKRIELNLDDGSGKYNRKLLMYLGH